MGRPGHRPTASWAALLLAGCGVVAVWRLAGAQDGRGTLQIRIVDAASGRPTPARLQVTDEQRRAHVAEDALLVGGDCRDRETPWVSSAEEARALLARPIANAFTGVDNFYADGRARLSLPPGRYEITGWKGIEFLAETTSVDVRAGRRAEVTLRLRRWIDMPARGWYGADPHLHVPRAAPDRNGAIARWMQAEDVHFATLLQFGHSRRFVNASQYAFGPRGQHRDGTTFLAAGQENPRTHILGHTLIFGAHTAINFPDRYLAYRLFFEEARKQGAVVGYAHGGVYAGAQSGLGLDLPQDLVDFIEVLQNDEGLYDVWYSALNTGFRVIPVAGSDYPCPTTFPGRNRFYTEVRGAPTYAGWIEGVRAGRTFVTNGPLLELRVADQPMGGEARLAAPGTVRIEARVRFDPTRDDVRAIELVDGGEVVRTFTPDPAGDTPLALDHPVREATWLALRVAGVKRGENAPRASLAHSAPVWVSLQDAPPLARSARARALARMWHSRLVELEHRLRTQADHIGMGSWNDDVPGELVARNRRELGDIIRAAKRHFAAQASP